MKKIGFWSIVTAMVLASCGGGTRQPDEVFCYETPVDLSDLISAVEKERMEPMKNGKSESGEEDEGGEWVEPEGWTEGMGYELFKDTSFVVRLPQYEGSEQPFLKYAEDFYNSCTMAHNVQSNLEMVARELATEEDVLKTVQAIGVDYLKNVELKKRSQMFVDSLVVALQQDAEVPEEEREEPYGGYGHYMELIDSLWSDIEELVVYEFYTSEEAFVDSLDSLIIRMDGMVEKQYMAYKNSSKDLRVKVMLEQMNACKTFDEQCALFLRWADSKESMSEGKWLLKTATRLMKSGKYNPLLYHVWLDWRCLTQGMLGASRDSEIPNQLYNEMRRVCYLACLKRIEAFPRDALAMNCAAVLGGRANMLRIGSFMFGNDAVLEQYQFMPKRFQDDEEDEKGEAEELPSTGEHYIDSLDIWVDDEGNVLE